jgi:hypothetical protein
MGRVLGGCEFANFLEDAGNVSSDVLECDFGVLAEADVSVVPPECVVAVCVILTQYLAFFGVVVLESIEPPAWVLIVGNAEQLNAAAGDGPIQFQWVVSSHQPTFPTYDL